MQLRNCNMTKSAGGVALFTNPGVRLSNSNKWFLSLLCSPASRIFTWKWTYLASALTELKMVTGECLNASTIDVLDLTILCCGGCPVHWRLFSSISGLYPPDAWSSHRSSCGSQDVSRHCQMFLRGRGGTPPWWRTTGLENTSED